MRILTINGLSLGLGKSSDKYIYSEDNGSSWTEYTGPVANTYFFQEVDNVLIVAGNDNLRAFMRAVMELIGLKEEKVPKKIEV